MGLLLNGSGGFMSKGRENTKSLDVITLVITGKTGLQETQEPQTRGES